MLEPHFATGTEYLAHVVQCFKPTAQLTVWDQPTGKSHPLLSSLSWSISEFPFFSGRGKNHEIATRVLASMASRLKMKMSSSKKVF